VKTLGSDEDAVYVNGVGAAAQALLGAPETTRTPSEPGVIVNVGATVAPVNVSVAVLRVSTLALSVSATVAATSKVVPEAVNVQVAEATPTVPLEHPEKANVRPVEIYDPPEGSVPL
jgi:hypothetical protein